VKAISEDSEKAAASSAADKRPQPRTARRNDRSGKSAKWVESLRSSDVNRLWTELHRIVSHHPLVRASRSAGLLIEEGSGAAYTDLTQELFVQLLSKNRFEHYLETNMSDYEIECEISQIELPCVLSIQTGINEPRYVGMRGIRQVASIPIPTFAASDLGVDSSAVGLPAAKVRRVDYFTPAVGKGAEILQGSREEIVGKLFDLVAAKGGLK